MFLFGYNPSDPNNPNYGMQPPNGMFFSSEVHGMEEALDGTSNTALYSEHIKGDFNQAVATERSDTFRPGTYPADIDTALADCLGVNEANLSTQFNSNAGGGWINSGHTPNRYYHSFLPGARSCAFPSNRIVTTANSGHPQGVNVLMFDGSVHFVSYSINLQVWRGLGTRNGREVVGSTWE